MSKFPISNCPFCLKNKTFVINQECGHQFCAKCTANLIKITKIKKGLGVSILLFTHLLVFFEDRGEGNKVS